MSKQLFCKPGTKKKEERFSRHYKTTTTTHSQQSSPPLFIKNCCHNLVRFLSTTSGCKASNQPAHAKKMAQQRLLLPPPRLTGDERPLPTSKYSGAPRPRQPRLNKNEQSKGKQQTRSPAPTPTRASTREKSQSFRAAKLLRCPGSRTCARRSCLLARAVLGFGVLKRSRYTGRPSCL